MATEPRISVVLPVRNEARSLPSVLQQLLAQEIAPEAVEIIVADGCSTDDTVAVASAIAAQSRIPIRIVRNERVLSSGGRNAGMQAARGDVIVFLDGHCHIPSRQLLADTLRLLDETGADCLCRPQPLLAPSASATGRVIAAVRGSTLGHGRDSLIYNMQLSAFVHPASSGATYRTAALRAVGPYDERFDACEDVELNTRIHKAGMRAFTDPALAVYYEPRSTLSGLWKQMVRYGRGRIRLAGRHPETLSVSTILPMILLLLLLAMLASLPFPGLVRTTLVIIAALYCLALVAASVQLGSKQHGSRCYWQAPFAYAAIHLGLGFGLLHELVSFRWLKLRANAGPSHDGEAST